MTIKYPHIKVDISTVDSNAFSILGICSKAMRRAKLPQSEIDAFYKEATSGNYDHLLATCMGWIDCFGTDSD